MSKMTSWAIYGILFSIMLALGTSCTQVLPMGGDLSLRSRSGAGLVAGLGSEMSGAFPRGYYSVDGDQGLTLVLLEGTEENPSRAVTMRMQWRPRAGKTPIDRNATNATIHYAIFTGSPGGEVGVYSGAGFVFPRGTAGDETLRLSLWDSSLRLLDRTNGFQDLLGQAILTGDLQVEHNPAQTRLIIAQLDRLLTDKLGYPRVVQVAPSHED